MNRAQLVEAARRSIALGSRSFALASTLFDRETRERAWLLYAWCRAADDITDGQEMGHGMVALPDIAGRVAGVRAKTEAALAGTRTGEVAFDALAQVAREVRLPHRYPIDLVRGFEMDAEGFQPASFDELLRYCYHVAGVVGVMMAIVMGVDPDDEATLDRACDLGLAFQLANIARDVREDATAGRCYLPADWLAEAGLSRAALIQASQQPNAGRDDGKVAEGVAILTRRLATQAERYEASARHGTPALSFRSAWAVLAAADIYGGIARKVARLGSVAWSRRVVTSTGAKLTGVAKTGVAATLRAWRWQASISREGLWTRSREP